MQYSMHKKQKELLCLKGLNHHGYEKHGEENLFTGS